MRRTLQGFSFVPPSRAADYLQRHRNLRSNRSINASREAKSFGVNPAAKPYCNSGPTSSATRPPCRSPGSDAYDAQPEQVLTIESAERLPPEKNSQRAMHARRFRMPERVSQRTRWPLIFIQLYTSKRARHLCSWKIVNSTAVNI